MASVENASSNNPQVVRCVEHASAGSFQRGDLVKLASNGKAQIATAGVIFGIARADATGTEDTVFEVERVNANDLYRARYTSSATSQALQGDVVDFTFTAGAHTLSESGATTDAYVVDFDLSGGESIGDTGGKLLIQFIQTAIDSQF